MTPLAGWTDFYVIVGTAAATLTGLMFVVITLVSGSMARPLPSGAGVYSTPTVVHFGATLLIAVLLAAPWPSLWEVGIPLGGIGLAGMGYGLVVARRTGRDRGRYEPVLEDWLCHAILPTLGYAAILAGAIVLQWRPVLALFMVAGVVVLFLSLGVHNAWDIVTYLTFEHRGPGSEGGAGE
jgi:hypothetical protein